MLRKVGLFCLTLLLTACATEQVSKQDEARHLAEWHAFDHPSAPTIRVAIYKMEIEDYTRMMGRFTPDNMARGNLPTAEEILAGGGKLQAAAGFSLESISKECPARYPADQKIYLCFTHVVPSIGLNQSATRYDQQLMNVVTRQEDDTENSWHTWISGNLNFGKFDFSYGEKHLFMVERVK